MVVEANFSSYVHKCDILKKKSLVKRSIMTSPSFGRYHTIFGSERVCPRSMFRYVSSYWEFAVSHPVHQYLYAKTLIKENMIWNGFGLTMSSEFVINIWAFSYERKIKKKELDVAGEAKKLTSITSLSTEELVIRDSRHASTRSSKQKCNKTILSWGFIDNYY